MKWSEVFTRRQKHALLGTIHRELVPFLDWVRKCDFKEEAYIAGRIGIADKLVVRDGLLWIMWWDYNHMENGHENPCFQYKPVGELDSLICDFELTLEDIQEARERIEKLRAEEAKNKKRQLDKAHAANNAVMELEALRNSPACNDLLHEITLAEDKKLGMALLLSPRFGLCQVVNHGSIESLNDWPFDDLIELVHRFDLSAEKLRRVRKMIEA